MPLPRQHAAQSARDAAQLKLAFGNGLRAAVWEKFQTRFRIPQILEFYGSTEGNVSLFNFEGQSARLGESRVLRKARCSPGQVDQETDEPIRNAHGFCIVVPPRESARQSARYKGTITRSTDTPTRRREEKILRDVFERATRGSHRRPDAPGRAGGYLYFVDRIGDTFRWKGENVSTTEVAATVPRPGVLEAVVYGVNVAGHGRRPAWPRWWSRDDFDLAAFHQYSTTTPRVRPPAVPAHPRTNRRDRNIQAEEETISLHESYDPSATTDPISSTTLFYKHLSGLIQIALNQA